MPGPYMAAGVRCYRCRPCSVAAAVRFCGGVKTPPYRAGGKRGLNKKLPADSWRGAQGCLPENYTRVFRTSCAGTGASMGRGVPSTHWMAFLGHLLTQVPQPLHLV